MSEGTEKPAGSERSGRPKMYIYSRMYKNRGWVYNILHIHGRTFLTGCIERQSHKDGGFTNHRFAWDAPFLLILLQYDNAVWSVLSQSFTPLRRRFHHFHPHDVDAHFPFAFGTIQRKIDEDGLRIDLLPGFLPAVRARHPGGFSAFVCAHGIFLRCTLCVERLASWQRYWLKCMLFLNGKGMLYSLSSSNR